MWASCGQIMVNVDTCKSGGGGGALCVRHDVKVVTWEMVASFYYFMEFSAT